MTSPNLIQLMDDFERRCVSGEDTEGQVLWKQIRDNVQQMLSVGSTEGRSPSNQPLILVATPEVVSLPTNMGNLANIITTGDGGGLADISAALVTELDRLGVNVHVALPEYRSLFEELTSTTRGEYEQLKNEIRDRGRIHLIADDMFTKASRVYGDEKAGLDKIDLRRANAFQRGIISRLLPNLKREHSRILVHCNDWMTGLVPAAARSQGIQSLMTFHNIFTYYQWPKGLQKHSIDIEPFWHYLYFREHPDMYGSYAGNYEYNEVDFMTSGLFAADFINTVSPTFLKEIVEGYFLDYDIIPVPMRRVVCERYREGAAVGILNAPPAGADPRKDELLVRKYWYEDAGRPDIVDLQEGKEENKRCFQQELNLRQDEEIPLYFWPSRIAYPQKGFELLLALIPELMGDYGRDQLQIAVVANGDPVMIERIMRYQEEFPGAIGYQSFTRRLSQLGKAASDFILMPSLYEPCGIPQVEAPRYGSLPIVRRTGGLADTVDQLSGNGLIGNGFVFEPFTVEGLRRSLDESMEFYRRGRDYRGFVQRRIMKENFNRFNIERTARAYIDIYETIFRQHDADEVSIT